MSVQLWMRVRPLAAAGIIVASLIAAGCGKGAAETALLASDEAILRVTPDAGRYAPDALASLIAAAREARAAYDRGDYEAARQLASRLPARADGVRQEAAAARTEAIARWDEIRDVLPTLLNVISDKLAALATMTRPPTFISPEEAVAAGRRLAEANESWSVAIKAFNEGDLLAALASAEAARNTAYELAALLEPVVLPPTGDG